jgi:HEAT repeat protein
LARLPAITARTTAETLVNLDSRAAVPGLVELLESTSDHDAFAAAHKALVKLTGTDLPAEPDAWRGWLRRTGSR